MTIQKQYGPGLLFDQAKVFGEVELPAVLDSGPLAHSGTRVAQIRRVGSCGDFCQNTVVGHFASTRTRVGLWAGSFGDRTETTKVTLTALNAGGGVVAEQSGYVSGGAPFATRLLVTATSNACKPYAFPCIKSFMVHSQQNSHGAFDDLTFDVPAVPRPDFGLTWSGRVGTTTGTFPAVPVAPGGSVSTSLIMTRAFPSSGPVKLAGPSGPISLTFAPATTTAPDGASIPVKVVVAANARCGSTTTLTGTGVAVSAAAGPPDPHPFTIPVYVTCGGESVSLDGIEVTQGTQTLGALPAKNPAKPTAAVPYSGVKLARDAPTIVRVYASSVSSAPGGKVADVGAKLYGWSAIGTPLPGSPLLPDGGPRTLVPGPSTTLAHRGRSADAYVFTLPPSWAVGLDTRLRAELYHGGLSFDSCTTTACTAQRSMTLSGIPFSLVRGYGVTPLQLVAPGALDPSTGKPWTPPPPPENVFYWTRKQLPQPVGKHGLVLIPYQAVLDISKLATLPTAPVDKRNDAILQVVADWESGTMTPFAGVTGDMTIGVDPGVRGRGVMGMGTYQWIGQVALARPFTSVTHELFHGMTSSTNTLQHADSACAGGGGVGWPDPYGFTEGIGLDPAVGSAPGSAGYDVKLAGNPGQPPQWYDPMSYCANDTDAWVSPINWDLIMGYLTDKSSLAHRASEAEAAAPAGGRLLVTATVDSAHDVRIGLVKPALDQPPPPGQPTGFELRALDANGGVVAQGPMTGSLTHAERGAPVAMLTGTTQASSVDRVEVVQGNVVVASRRRSPHTPTVRLLAPQPDTTVGADGTVPVRWAASDADGDELTVKIDYSSGDARGWRTVYIGPNSGAVNLDSRYLSAATEGRLRLRVSDGFNESIAESDRLHAVGAPPSLHVFAPVPGLRVRSDATLLLDGEAWDDASQRLDGSNLRWYDGEHQVASGEAAGITGLSPGLHHIRLVARDTLGRTSVANADVHVSGVAPRFLVLRAPQAVPRAAVSVRVTVATSIPATLPDGVHVGRETRIVRIPIRPGAGPQTLTLRVRAAGRTTTSRLTVRRR